MHAVTTANRVHTQNFLIDPTRSQIIVLDLPPPIRQSCREKSLLSILIYPLQRDVLQLTPSSKSSYILLNYKMRITWDCSSTLAVPQAFMIIVSSLQFACLLSTGLKICQYMNTLKELNQPSTKTMDTRT